MTPDNALLEALSRLMDGELDPTEAAALHHRIATEPEVADAWSALHQLTAQLGTLPTAAPPPPALDARVLRKLTAPQPHKPRWPRWPLLLVPVAAALLLALRPAAPPPQVPVTLIAGVQRIEGQGMRVDTPTGHHIEVDGLALVRLSPADNPHTQDIAMVRSIAAAAAGAVLTIVVYEGTARVHTDDGAPSETIQAGATRSFTTDPSAPRPHGTPPDAPMVLVGDARITVDEAAARILALEDELAGLRLERDMQNGALEALEGSPQEWPENVPAAFQEAGMADRLDALATANPQLEVVGLDCEEYPCLAIVRDHSGKAGWMEGLQAKVADGWSDQDALGIGFWVHQSGEDPQESVNLAGIALRGDDDGTVDDDAVDTRTQWRMDGWIQETTNDLQQQQEPTPRAP